MTNSNSYGQKLFLSGSAAIAQTVANCQPGVIATYPITPQTEIIKYLTKLKDQQLADFSILQTESEHSALSATIGSTAMGVPTYTATSSQGLLHMIEVVYNIPGLRLPVVMTCANRSISAPINIWNDHQDAMAARETGWLMLFAENIQEAIEQHWLAFVLSQKLRLPVMINVDGFRLTHTSEPVIIPTTKLIKKILTNKIKPILDVNNPQTTGWLAQPADYHQQRLELKSFINNSLPIIKETTTKLYSLWTPVKQKLLSTQPDSKTIINQPTIEYYGPDQPKLIIVALGSIISDLKQLLGQSSKIGLLKIKVYRPFPAEDIWLQLSRSKQILVIDRSPGLGAQPPLFSDLKASQTNNQRAPQLTSLICGLGGYTNLNEIKQITKNI